MVWVLRASFVPILRWANIRNKKKEEKKKIKNKKKKRQIKRKEKCKENYSAVMLSE